MSTTIIRPHQRARRLRRTATVLTATTAALLLGAGTALAHVSVTPETVATGGYSTLAFRVPNESDSAATTKVEIQLPTDTPFAFVSAQQTPGWTVEVVETKLPAPVTAGDFTVDEAVSSVTFTADGAGLPPHQFTVFSLMVGPVPDVGTLTLPAIQTYDDGEVVNWNEPTPAGGEEPENPAPTVTVTSATTDQAAAPAASAASSIDTTARVLGIAGIVVGLAGVGTGVVLARGRRRGPDEGGSA